MGDCDGASFGMCRFDKVVLFVSGRVYSKSFWEIRKGHSQANFRLMLGITFFLSFQQQHRERNSQKYNVAEKDTTEISFLLAKSILFLVLLLKVDDLGLIPSLAHLFFH